MAYIIKKPQPFVIKGEKAEYLIPAFSQLSADEVEELLKVPDMAPHERVKVFKAFLLRMAPGLEEEGLGDMGYAEIYAAYEKEQAPGK